MAKIAFTLALLGCAFILAGAMQVFLVSQRMGQLMGSICLALAIFFLLFAIFSKKRLEKTSGLP